MSELRKIKSQLNLVIQEFHMRRPHDFGVGGGYQSIRLVKNILKRFSSGSRPDSIICWR